MARWPTQRFLCPEHSTSWLWAPEVLSRVVLWLDTNDNSGETLWGLVLIQLKQQKSGESRAQAAGSKRSQGGGHEDPTENTRGQMSPSASSPSVADVGGPAELWRRPGSADKRVSPPPPRTCTAVPGACREQFILLCLRGVCLMIAQPGPPSGGPHTVRDALCRHVQTRHQHSRGAPAPNAIALGVRFQVMNFEGTQTFG